MRHHHLPSSACGRPAGMDGRRVIDMTSTYECMHRGVQQARQVSARAHTEDTPVPVAPFRSRRPLTHFAEPEPEPKPSKQTLDQDRVPVLRCCRHAVYGHGPRRTHTRNGKQTFQYANLANPGTPAGPGRGKGGGAIN